ncbi:hypothetical protein Tco_0446361 [Tanacetum coccineum]
MAFIEFMNLLRYEQFCPEQKLQKVLGIFGLLKGNFIGSSELNFARELQKTSRVAKLKLYEKSEVKAIKETEKLLNKAIPHEHEIEKSFKLQSKDVQINPVQAVDANLVVTKSSGIESENNSTDNALNKL